MMLVLLVMDFGLEMLDAGLGVLDFGWCRCRRLNTAGSTFPGGMFNFSLFRFYALVVIILAANQPTDKSRVDMHSPCPHRSSAPSSFRFRFQELKLGRPHSNLRVKISLILDSSPTRAVAPRTQASCARESIRTPRSDSGFKKPKFRRPHSGLEYCITSQNLSDIVLIVSSTAAYQPSSVYPPPSPWRSGPIYV
ncbi:hypothetical protein CPB83DRAFT_75549 [Crepidotus variabilis]|uniref:Uncharacterized protein n=1 Tax=Crepidotus variabilis TaxID=179855 RepID=A0A9P6EKQ4_9AGAR|nr:hypothetical protein CPB83DRAFT_75549 [Crepidotus variabilis]